MGIIACAEIIKMAESSSLASSTTHVDDLHLNFEHKIVLVYTSIERHQNLYFV